MLAKAPLESAGLDGSQDAELARLAFRTELVVKDMEIRVWTSDRSNLTVTRVEIASVDSIDHHYSKTQKQGVGT